MCISRHFAVCCLALDMCVYFSVDVDCIELCACDEFFNATFCCSVVKNTLVVKHCIVQVLFVSGRWMF